MTLFAMSLPKHIEIKLAASACPSTALEVTPEIRSSRFGVSASGFRRAGAFSGE